MTKTQKNLFLFADSIVFVVFFTIAVTTFIVAILFIENSIIEVVSHHYELQSVITDYVHDEKEFVLVSTSSFMWKTDHKMGLSLLFLVAITIVMIVDCFPEQKKQINFD